MKKHNARSLRSSIVERGGVTFLWALNDQCDRASLLEQLEKFQLAGVEALVLHPRAGLLLPYGGSDWFETMEWLVRECRHRAIEPILYDEDPFPSGNAGGRIVAEHPEFVGYGIERFTACEQLKENELFVFPSGRLCWAGIVFPDTRAGMRFRDLTVRVGMIRRHWEKAEWDSRWYYPATPLYSCPRAIAHHAEFALKVPKIPPGGRLLAFVARPVTSRSEWGLTVDTLNPKATRCFLEYTHERYERILGRELGRSVRTIFTDEAKPQSEFSWTPGMFEMFQQQYSYDLRPRLEALFSDTDSPHHMKVRLDYREWISKRFERTWMKPVSDWCARQGLTLIGHLSPEEDPVNQAASIGNLFPLQKHLSLSGFDLIIPALGDQHHPLLNVAAISALSSAQQNKQSGVCCESLGASGLQIKPGHIARVLAWQILNGVNLAVLHAAFQSQIGLRRVEAPPDYGPRSPLWSSIQRMNTELKPFFQATLNAIHEAPVAILWPIRSFQARSEVWQHEDNGLRKDLLDLLSLCLENQIGVHLLDENELDRGKIQHKPENRLLVGNANYECVVIPSATVLADSSFQKLERLAKAGIKVIGVGETPAWKYSPKAPLAATNGACWPVYNFEDFRSKIVTALPRLLPIQEKKDNKFQISIWKKERRREMFVMNLDEYARSLPISGGDVPFGAGELVRFIENGGMWEVHSRFSPTSFQDDKNARAGVQFGCWEMCLPGKPPIRSEHPLGAWQLTPHHGRQNIDMVLTPRMSIGGGKLVDSITYQVKANFPPHSKNPVLWIEPTLMRGNFTLKSGSEEWKFAVSDTDTVVRKISLEKARKNGSINLHFTLHNPEAPDGIKHHPHIEVRTLAAPKPRRRRQECQPAICATVA